MEYAPNPKNWTEDFSHENGNYSNICKICDLGFIGHKMRRVCKQCASSDSMVQAETKLLNLMEIHDSLESFFKALGLNTNTGDACRYLKSLKAIVDEKG